MWLAAAGLVGAGSDEGMDQIRMEADEIGIGAVLETMMLADISEGKEELRAMIRAFGLMWRAASEEWLVRRTLTRSDVGLLVTDTLLHLLRVTYPAMLEAHHAARTGS